MYFLRWSPPEWDFRDHLNEAFDPEAVIPRESIVGFRRTRGRWRPWNFGNFPSRGFAAHEEHPLMEEPLVHFSIP